MKIRMGFVSNSSSTSFTCEVCGVTEAGSDCCRINDMDYFRCENGHEICFADGIDVDSIENYYEADKKHCPICQNQAVSLFELPYIMAFLLERPLHQIKKSILELSEVNGPNWIPDAIKFAKNTL